MEVGDKVCIPTCERNADKDRLTKDTCAVIGAKSLGQDYIFLVKLSNDGKIWTVGDRPGSYDSSFLAKDLILYEANYSIY